ncbi:MAG: DUF819 family protein [Gemmatimonadaceae bacterium]|nr:DUF819 family protein [Gemmatimonadaceae bacterium]
MLSSPLAVLAVLALVVLASEWLVRRTVLRHAGTALLGILLAAVLANVGLIPAGSTTAEPVPVYDGIFTYVAPLAIFWLLLGVNLRTVRKAGVPMLALFLIGAWGTAVGAFAAAKLVGGGDALHGQLAGVAGMFTGTYVGGSINFNAVALEYDVVRDGVVYTASIVADNIVTTIWMVATLTLPRLLAPMFRGIGTTVSAGDGPVLGIEEDTEPLHPVDLAVVLGLGAGGVWIAEVVALWLSGRGVRVPTMLVLTVIALLLAQIPAVARLRGPRVIGLFAVYLFLTVIGAFCDLRALVSVGELGVTLLLFALITVGMHGVVIFGSARLFRMDATIAAIASQANVGGGTSALACARSLGREDLVLPAVLVGSVGNALGNFLGFWVASRLG